MKLTHDTNAFQLRIMLTKEVYNIDKVAHFSTDVLTQLITVSNTLVKSLEIEREIVSTPVVKEMIGLDIETVKLNVNVMHVAMTLKMFESVDVNGVLNPCELNMN